MSTIARLWRSAGCNGVKLFDLGGEEAASFGEAMLEFGI